MGRNLTNLNIKDTYEDLVQISGSILTDGLGSTIPSVEITASNATNAVSSSYAVSASHATFAETAGGATDVNALYTASVVDANIAFIKGGGSTFAIEVNNVSSSISASYATQAGNATTADSATSASYANIATSASHAVNADTSISSSYALTASYAENALTPNLQQVLDEGSTATGSIELYNVATAESALFGWHTNGAKFVSNRVNSVLHLGTNNLSNGITIGRNNAVGFFGDGGEASTPYSFQSNLGYIKVPFDFQSSFTASGLNYPTADGTTGQVITTDGSGNLSFSTAGGGGDAFPFSGSAVITGSLLVSGSTIADTIVLQTSKLNGGGETQITELSSYGAGTIGASVVNGAIIASGDSSIANAAAYNGFVAGTDSSNLNGGNNSAIVGGFSNTLNGDKGFVGGGESNNIGGGSSYTAMGATNSTIAQGGNTKTIIGGNNNTINTFGTSLAIIGSGNSNIDTGNNIYGSTIVGGSEHKISINSDNSGIYSGYQNKIFGGQAFGANMGQNNVIVGGLRNQISGSGTGNTNIFNSAILGGSDNRIPRDSTYSGILISSGSAITSTHTGSVIIGGKALTTTKSDEVVVPHLTISGSGNLLTFADGTTQSTAAAGGAAFPFSGSAVITGSIDFADEKVLINQAATTNTIAGQYNVSIGNENGSVSGNYSTAVGTRFPNVPGVYAAVYGGNILSATANWSTAIGGESNTASGTYSAVIGGSGNTASNTRSAVIGGTGLTTTQDNEVVVPNLTISGSGAILTFADGTTQSTAGGGGGAAFPFSGSALITGSLIVSGSTTADLITLQTKNISGGNEPQITQLSAYGGGTIGASVVNGAIIASGDSSIANSAAYNGFIAGGDSHNINGGNNTGIVGGFNNTINSDKGFIGGGEGHTISNSNSAIIGGSNNTSNAGGNNKVIIGGADSTLSNGSTSAMLNCRSSTFSITENNTIIGDAGSNHSLSPVQYQNLFLNNRNTRQDNSGYSYSCGNTITGNVSTYIQNVGQNNISNNYNGRVGKTHGGLILGNYAANTTHLFISGSDTGGSNPLAFNGQGDQNAVILTGTSRLNTSRKTTLWGTEGITASDLTGSFVLPNSSARTIDTDYTLYTENIDVRGSVVNEVGVISDTAGTTTMDCSTSNFFTLAMPAGGTTALTPSNIQAGQTISVKITQNATPSTLTFASSVDFEGGTAFVMSATSGAIDVMTFISFDGTTLQATGLKNFG